MDHDPATAELFTAIDHVGFAVQDLDEAIDFYQRTYGMTLVHEETNDAQGMREAMMRIGDSGSFIQLLAPLKPDSMIGRYIETSGPGVQQLAFRVDDIDAACETLRERGVRLLLDEPQRGVGGSRINFIIPEDAGGTLVELVEAAAKP